MKSSCILPSLVVAHLLATVPAAATTIGPVINPGNGHQYYVTHDLMTWDAGEAWALGLGGHLVTIIDAAENAWIMGNLPFVNDWYWIGGRDVAVEETFTWVSGEPWAYVNWAPGEPDNDAGLGGNADHLALVFTGKWTDTSGNVALAGAIAELLPGVDVDPVPSDGSRDERALTAISTRDGVRVRFGVPRAADVQLAVFDVRGRPVRTLYAGALGARAHEFLWDETDRRGRRVGNGLYFVSLRVEGVRRTARAVLAR